MLEGTYKARSSGTTTAVMAPLALRAPLTHAGPLLPQRPCPPQEPVRVLPGRLAASLPGPEGHEPLLPAPSRCQPGGGRDFARAGASSCLLRLPSPAVSAEPLLAARGMTGPIDPDRRPPRSGPAAPGPPGSPAPCPVTGGSCYGFSPRPWTQGALWPLLVVWGLLTSRICSPTGLCGCLLRHLPRPSGFPSWLRSALGSPRPGPECLVPDPQLGHSGAAECLTPNPLAGPLRRVWGWFPRV